MNVYNTGKWNDDTCSEKFPFVCRHPRPRVSLQDAFKLTNLNIYSSQTALIYRKLKRLNVDIPVLVNLCACKILDVVTVVLILLVSVVITRKDESEYFSTRNLNS